MKANQVLVATNGAYLGMAGGRRVVAVLPAPKGEKRNYAIDSNGENLCFDGARINGVGVKTYLQANGFEFAQTGNPDAERLAEVGYRKDSVAMVEAGLSEQARLTQAKFGGKECFFVSVLDGVPDWKIKVREREGGRLFVGEFGLGLMDSAVSVEFDDSGRTDPALTKGTFHALDEDLSKAPKLSEYGGIAEHAAFVLVNAGLATYSGTHQFAISDDEDERYIKGKIVLKLNDTDNLIVGITVLDLLEVAYVRNGETLYVNNKGLSSCSVLGQVVGDLASVICRVQDMDASSALNKGKRKKAA